MESIKFLNLDCVELSNPAISLLVTRSVGPRLISLTPAGGENLLAELSDAVLDCPGKGGLHLYGGHRLWHAPEEPGRTYLPDDQPVEVESIEGGLRATQPVEEETGIQKTIEVKLHASEPELELNHTLSNQGMWPVTCAPWAITQIKTGGIAILPQYTGLADDNPTLPNRVITLWPYTDIAGPHITWGNDHIMIRADMASGALKIGFPNPRGWLAYWREKTLFVKRATYIETADYFDHGSSSECYCNQDFIELETLGPITNIQPGGSVSHVERWEVITDVEWPKKTEDLIARIEGR